MSQPQPTPSPPHRSARKPRSLKAFLRPLPGWRLPRELRPLKVGRLARALPGGLRDPGFAALLSRIDGGETWWGGNRIEVYCDGEEATRSMLAAIDAAQAEVLVEFYIFTDDSTGKRFAQCLTAAAKRGVRVCVLADAIGSFSTAAAFWKQMQADGIEVHLFHRLFPDLWWHAFRDHRKILVIDRLVGFTGGMNIADEYSSFTLRKRRIAPGAMRDTHVRIEGPVAWDLAVVFAEGWERARGKVLPVTPPPANVDAPARSLVLDSRPGRGHVETAATLAAISAAAEKTLWLTNAYFAPGHKAVALLGRAAARGVDVRLLLPAKSDVRILVHAGHGWYSRLLRKGVRIFEYERAFLHAKTMVADRYCSVVGSTNLDFRSFQFNAECNLVTLDDEVGERLAKEFEGDLVHSREITREAWRRRTTRHRIADRFAGMLTPFL
ncbi:MAG TPA: phospholipase D-like domain-containing protein [Thermoanaerobaculia bacterium]|nr:phospholipase D-like domain-containing protein [Thermoanaerobaculia bacterium]